ncbi:hypothetical protein CEXT_130331 [Caerostris extrusa]|uniref:Uncharacterized protein n=1 Tax=Caerostris extrusa TaxID=172846 RepID=A0AAV4PIM6_CAEEX|nr:hypothetical protein CEXT_130331 [Caerostris extrusa]
MSTAVWSGITKAISKWSAKVSHFEISHYKRLTPQDLLPHISKATFEIHIRENPFPSSPTPPPLLNRCRRPLGQDFGSSVQRLTRR